MSLAFFIFPTLLEYNRYITLCNFKVYDTLIWWAYLLQFDYHCSAAMISLNTFLFLPTPALLLSNDTKVRSFVIVPQVPKVLFIFPQFILFLSLRLGNFCFIFNLVLFFVLFILQLSPSIEFLFWILCLFYHYKIFIWLFYKSSVPLLRFYFFVSTMFIIAHWSIVMLSPLKFCSDNSRECVTLVLVYVDYFFSFKLWFSWILLGWGTFWVFCYEILYLI